MIKNSVWYADTAVKNQFGDVTLGGTQHLQTTKMFTIQGQGSQIVHEIFTTVLNCQLSIVRHLTPSKYYITMIGGDGDGVLLQNNIDTDTTTRHVTL